MEVLSGGFTTKFWLPIEDEPDIDRFIDEDIAVDLNGFTLRGILRKVSTCKKKNKETKEFEYYKEITIDVVGLDTDAGQTIQIPDKKDEYQCAVELRYIPEEESLESDTADSEAELAKFQAVCADGPAPEDELDFEATADRDAELEFEKENNLDNADADATNEAEAKLDPAKDPQDEAYEGNEAEFVAEGDAEGDDFSFADEPAANAIVEPDKPDGPDKEPDIEADDFFDDPKPDNPGEDDFFDEPTSVDNGSGDEIKDKNPPDDDDDINWD